MRSKAIALAAGFVCSTLMSGGALAVDPIGEPGRSAGKKNPLKNVYFGEQHLHTQDSADSFAMGNRNSQDDAYNFCKGKPVKKSTTGKMVKKSTPYDWCAVTDHAYLLGLLPLTLDPKNPLSKTEVGKLISTGDPKDSDKAFGLMMKEIQKGRSPKGFDDMKVQQSAWENQKKITNKHYEPGKFTTLIAFEWTSLPNGANMHRNVFFRDDQGPDVIFTAVDSDRPEDLWNYLDVQTKLGHENFAIPHNGNVSNSMMYAPFMSDGVPFNKQRAQRRAKHEVATEIIQTKGQSDTHPALSPNDEFANFEMFTHLLGTGGVVGRIDYSYIRQALINGVGYQQLLGANPFKYGIVAGADSHDAMSDNEEFNYDGVHGLTDDTPKRRLTGGVSTAGEAPLAFGSPGTTAVWAPENTREAIFDGIKSKETYGTSGTLIRLRFFGGWDYSKNLDKDKNFVKKAYKGGVPMGGDLPKMPKEAKAPTFAVWAMKDPESGNLDRVQIVKGWFKGGHPWEKVYDVAWSDNRKPDPKTGKLPAVGNTVNVSKATYTNDIGDTQLSAVWTDPDFDPSLHAVYYVRVLEIPTPRWSTYDAARLGIEPPKEVPATIQERAWSSPIWYTPDPKLVKVEKPKFFPGLQPGIDF
jgi:hypothetical protein